VLYSTLPMVKYFIQLNYGNNKTNVIQLWTESSRVGILLNNSVGKMGGTWGVVSAPVMLLIFLSLTTK